LRNLFLKEMHNFPHTSHLGYQNTIAVVRGQYFWIGIKKDVVDYIAICMECLKVKDECRHPVIFLYPFPIPKWRWEVVTIYFITKILIIEK
jgi:hypothetical protein